MSCIVLSISDVVLMGTRRGFSCSTYTKIMPLWQKVHQYLNLREEKEVTFTEKRI